MFKVSATTTIHAAPHEVWAVITDFTTYEEWNTQLKFLGGTAAEGQRIKLRLEPKGGSGYNFEPLVIAYAVPEHFAWVARTGFQGVFDGEHHFKLERTGDGETVLHNYEIYSGLMSPIMKRLPMMKGAQEGFELMNDELKAETERRAAASSKR